MTAPVPAEPVNWGRNATAPLCACGQPSATIDGVSGRRCESCPRTYDRARALGLVRLGFPGAAWAYLGAAVAYGAVL